MCRVRVVKGVVFDMDGTLLDSLECLVAAYGDVVSAAGGVAFSSADVVAAFPLGPPRQILGHLLQRPATTGEEEAYVAALQTHADAVLVYQGVRHLLTALAALDIPVGVFTGASASSARQLLGDADLLEFFPVVVGGDEVEGRKPAPDGIHRACDLIGIPATEVGYVGDSPLDARAARRAGALAIAAGWGHLFDQDVAWDVVAIEPHHVLDHVRLRN